MKLIAIHSIYIICFSLLLSCSNELNQKVNQNESLAKSFILYWDRHDTEKLISLFADSCLYEEVATGRKFYDKNGIAGYATGTLSGIPDSKFEILTISAADSIAFVEWIWSGTNSVGWPDMGILPSNKQFNLRGISVMVIKDNKIVRNSDYWDWNSFIQRIE